MAHSTIKCYTRNLEWLVDILGNKKLNSIKANDLENVMINLSSKHTHGIGRAPSTVNRIKSVYRSFFKWAFESGRISFNPSTSLKLVKTDSKRTIPISPEEIEKLLYTIKMSGDNNAFRDEALFATYAFTGIRRAEAVSLRIADYDKIGKSINLPKSKGGQRRIIPVIPRLAEILEKYIFDIKQAYIIVTPPYSLGSKQTRHLSVRQVQNRFNQWKKAAKLRHTLTIHSFRAGFATQLYRQTRDIVLVYRAMGHRNINSINRYITYDNWTIRKAIEKIY